MIVAIDETGTRHHFTDAATFTAWRLAGNGGPLLRVVDISVAEPGPEQGPTAGCNPRSVGHQTR